MLPTVAIVDSDATTLHTLHTLLGTLDAEVQIFDSAESFLARQNYAVPALACLIVEATLPGMSGLQLLKRIRSADQELPIILLASEAEVALAVEAMRYGATDFIEKPQMDVALLRRVSQLLRNGVDAAVQKNVARS